MEEILAAIREKRKRFEALRAMKTPTPEEIEERKTILGEIEALNEERKLLIKEDDVLAKLDVSIVTPPNGGTPEGDEGRTLNIEVAPGTTRENPYGGDFGNFLNDVRSAESGVSIDKKLTAIRAASGQNETTGADGGWLLEPQMAIKIANGVSMEGTIANMCDNIPIGPNSNGLKTIEIDDKNSKVQAYRNGGVIAYFAAEAQAVSASKLQFKPREQSLQKIMAIAYATEEILQDSVALGATIETNATKAIKFVLEDKIFNGTGAGVPSGILTSGAAAVVARKTATEINFEDITKMSARMYVPSYANAVWFYNQEALPFIQGMYIPTGTSSGYPAYLPPGGLSANPYGTLMGRPAMPSEYLSALGTKGDLVLVDMKEYELITKGGITPSSSIHVKFLTDETAFKFTYRVNGQPKWEKPKTPFKGSATISPFVALGAAA